MPRSMPASLATSLDDGQGWSSIAIYWFINERSSVAEPLVHQ
jgi:hypothetical protein